MTTHDRRLGPDPILAMRLAAAAACDPRTAAKRLRGESVRGMKGALIDRAATELGVALPPVKPEQR